MKPKHFLFFALSVLLLAILVIPDASAQCALCNRVAAAQNNGASKGFNAGIEYLATIPLLLVGVVGIIWYRHEHELPQQEGPVE